VTSGGYIRRQRFSELDPIIETFIKAGYNVEPAAAEEGTVSVEFYARGPEIRNERNVSVWEKVSLAVLLQRYWADNAVSATFSFSPEETGDIGRVIAAYGDQLKTLSFLPMGEEGDPSVYPQMPYESIPEEDFQKKFDGVKPLDFEVLYNGLLGDAAAEKFCTNDTCEI
jgi:hypothetical protein